VIAQWCSAGLRAGRSGFYGLISDEGGNFSHPKRLWVPSVSCPMDTRGSFLGGKAAGA
jgi:hypothetical protein